jgi:hypothetical protein
MQQDWRSLVFSAPHVHQKVLLNFLEAKLSLPCTWLASMRTTQPASQPQPCAATHSLGVKLPMLQAAIEANSAHEQASSFLPRGLPFLARVMWTYSKLARGLLSWFPKPL